MRTPPFINEAHPDCHSSEACPYGRGNWNDKRLIFLQALRACLKSLFMVNSWIYFDETLKSQDILPVINVHRITICAVYPRIMTYYSCRERRSDKSVHATAA